MTSAQPEPTRLPPKRLRLRRALLALPLTAIAAACGATADPPRDDETGNPDASAAEATPPSDGSAADARAKHEYEPRPDVPHHWPARRCPGRLPDHDAQAWTEHSEGGACLLENTCGPSSYVQPGDLCDDFVVCFDTPYQGALPGRFAACERYADAPECCTYRGPLNADSYYRRRVDPSAMDEICALTALGAHVSCRHWLN